ncbi:hypothetical protein BJ912DRAFT_1143676 [Pholiota molesta]|nr:hypothetical protein BJ912DRAFT_1143676 [Pholiota molesta]
MTLHPSDDDMKQPLLSNASTSESTSAPPDESPPAYDYGTYSDENVPKNVVNQDVIVQRVASGGPSYTLQPSSTPPPTIFHYINPATGERVVSLLPPNHPEMICLQQGHVKETHFGLLGILAAIFWFPLGVGLCMLDKQVHCRRCGAVIEHGLCR